MDNVRAEWSKELDEIGSSGDAGFLEKIILQFDKRNWEARQIESSVVLNFVEPEDRTHRLAAVREENERHMVVLTFPKTCRRLIDERKEMTQEELESFWQQLRNIADDAEHARTRGDVSEHAILGGIAVLTMEYGV